MCGRKPYPERKSCGFKNIQILVDRALGVSCVHCISHGCLLMQMINITACIKCVDREGLTINNRFIYFIGTSG